MDYATTMDRLTPLLNAFTGAHVAAYRATGGRIGHWAPGAPTMLLLDHVGARSGRLRTTPLLYFDCSGVTGGDDVAVVASFGGHPRHPAWLHNLRAHPDTAAQIRDEVRPVHAREATEAERTRLWPLARTTYPGYDAYQRRADEAGRTIPIVVLTRRAR